MLGSGPLALWFLGEGLAVDPATVGREVGGLQGQRASEPLVAAIVAALYQTLY
jgi:hypothetical protein